MKRTLLASALVLAATHATATPVFHPSGANLSYGGASNTQSIFSTVNNPAAGASVFNKRDNGEFRMGVWSSLGVGLELAQMDRFVDNFDALQAEMNNNNPTIDSVRQMKQTFDGFLVQLGDEAYLAQLDVATHIPLMPLVIAKPRLGGSLVFDVNLGVQTKLRFLDSPLEFNPETQEPETNSAVYAKAGAVGQASLGYSREVLNTDLGALYTGVRGSYYQVGLRKTLLGFAVAEDLNILLENEGSKPMAFSSGFGLDLGVLFVGDRFRVGAEIDNLNSPSFAYDTIGGDCSTLTGTVADSCNIANAYSDEIDLQEVHVMHPQARLEAAVFSASQNWVLGLVADANPVNDLLGNPTQHVGISGAYASGSWIVPGFRLGVHTNLAGTQLSYASIGLSLFKIAHADAAIGLDSIDVDGQTLPRKLALNLGLDLSF